jgi:16S rRNA (cytidine1402-2'-O)-methyltransferase
VRGTLFIVSTPIGNLEDITIRALRVLREVDVVAAEDTRHSSKLLNHYGISKPLMSYWGERERERSGEVVNKLLAGQSVALISDAGTPGISDPGRVVIEKAIMEEIPVVPVPGPSALVAALSISGINAGEFTFAGFLPGRKAQRLKRLRDLSVEPRTLVFYEAPHRVVETMEEAYGVLGGRMAALVKEITKLHEEVLRGSLGEINRMLRSRVIAGEYVIIIEGRKRESVSLDEALKDVRMLMKKGKGRKEAVRIVSGEYGISRKDLYQKSLP